MSKDKKKVRDNFRSAVFKRDNYQCRICRAKPTHNTSIENFLDAHHIKNREAMPSGGYVKENGISLCSTCHIKAEEFYKTGVAVDEFSPEDLYKLIDSSYEKAYEMSLKLNE